jgi:hypothetical protein
VDRHLREKLGGLDAGIGQRNPLGSGSAESCDLTLGFALSSGHMLYYLLLADADLGKVFEYFLHGWGGIAAWEHTMGKKKKKELRR